MAKRINHKKLHTLLEEMGYEVYTISYKEGGHCYQIESPTEHHEYRIEVNKQGKAINLYGVDESLYSLIENYYQEQGLKIINQFPN